MDATPTNRFGGALPEDQTGQPYTFSDYMDDAIEVMRDADRLERDIRYCLRPQSERQRLKAQLDEAERLIEQARRML